MEESKKSVITANKFTSRKTFGKIGLFFKTLRQKRLITVAGSWVFFFLLSVVPLFFLLIVAFGVFGVDISLSLVGKIPEEFKSTVQAIIEAANNVSKGTTVFFVITSIISCSSLLNRFSKDGDYIYGLYSKRKRGVFRRLWALVAIAVLFAVFLISAVFVMFGNFLIETLGWGKLKGLVAVLFFAFIIFLAYILIILLNLFISPVKVSFRELLVGSFVSLVVIVLGTIGFILYLRFFNTYNAFYGSLAGIIVFLLWAYIAMIGLVLGTIVNMLIFKNKKRESNSKREILDKKENANQ